MDTSTVEPVLLQYSQLKDGSMNYEPIYGTRKKHTPWFYLFKVKSLKADQPLLFFYVM